MTLADTLTTEGAAGALTSTTQLEAGLMPGAHDGVDAGGAVRVPGGGAADVDAGEGSHDETLPVGAGSPDYE